MLKKFNKYIKESADVQSESIEVGEFTYDYYPSSTPIKPGDWYLFNINIKLS